MATSRPKSGVTEYTATTGAGSLTLTGAAPGFRGFVSADDGLSYPYAIYQEGTAFETGRRLLHPCLAPARPHHHPGQHQRHHDAAEPRRRHQGSHHCHPRRAGGDVGRAATSWSADQIFNSNRLYLDDGNSWIEATVGRYLRMFLSSTQAIDINYNSGLTYFQIIATNESGSRGTGARSAA